MLALKAKPEPVRELNKREQLRSVPEFDNAQFGGPLFQDAAMPQPVIAAPGKLALERTEA